MSLFKLRDFWSSGQLVNADLRDRQEEFDCNSLAISALNTESDFILCGSHMGVLRMFQPSCEIVDGALMAYQASDLIIEKSLNAPILQVSCGRLVSGSPQIQIAILHPRSFAVHSFTAKEGATEQGNQNSIHLLYEHQLRRSAANFVIGPFGNTQNRDFIAVQSLDGMISFYEQETFVFACFLPDFLLPGCFVYARRTDCFIITGSTLGIESYSYKNLSTTGQNSSENDAEGFKCQCEWSVNVSEHVLEVQYLYDGFSKESWLLFLGERYLYCLTDLGQIRFMKRLDFNPMTMTAFLLSISRVLIDPQEYISIADENIMTCIVSETSTMLILENTRLKWSALFGEVPVAISRANFRNMRGIFVSLSEEGNVRCSYLGTEPNLFQAPPLQRLEVDYEAAEKELIELTRVIKSSQGDLQAPERADLLMSTELKCLDSEVIVETTLILQGAVEEVNLTINVEEPCSASPRYFFLVGSSLEDKTTVSSSISCAIGNLLRSLDVDVIATCVSTMGMPKVYKSRLTLPPQIALASTTPSKENALKLVLNVNETAPNLFELFPEFADCGTPNMMALNLNSSDAEPSNAVTLLLAKSSSRYRLQSDSLSAFNVPLQEFTRRIRTHFQRNGNFELTFTGSLPLKELGQDLLEHYTLTQDIERQELELVELGGQFRLIQKRLISKFKDRHPTPLSNLNMLLQDTYSEVLQVTDKIRQLQQALKHSQSQLANSLGTISQLLLLSNVDIDRGLVENFLGVGDIEGMHWEDVLNAIAEYLLRTRLASSEKDRLRGASESCERIADFGKFQKHFLLAIDRLLKKGAPHEEAAEKDNAEDDEDEKRDVLRPIGSKFGESSTRILSARYRKPKTGQSDLSINAQSELPLSFDEELLSPMSPSE